MRHVLCKNIPTRTIKNDDGTTEVKNLKEEDYIMIYRKQLAKFRYEIY